MSGVWFLLAGEIAAGMLIWTVRSRWPQIKRALRRE